MPKARMLTAHRVGDVILPPDAVPVLSEADLAALVEAGIADPNPDAVAYAEALGVPMPDGYVPAEEPPPPPPSKAAKGA